MKDFDGPSAIRYDSVVNLIFEYVYVPVTLLLWFVVHYIRMSPGYLLSWPKFCVAFCNLSWQILRQCPVMNHDCFLPYHYRLTYQYFPPVLRLFKFCGWKTPRPCQLLWQHHCIRRECFNKMKQLLWIYITLALKWWPCTSSKKCG